MTTAMSSALVAPAKKQRVLLTFSVEGLAAREELLFKGYVRLLDNSTDHHWQYREPSGAHRVDLLVADERVQPTRFSQAAGAPQPVLQLGTSKGASHHFFLCWPLKPYELEHELNRLGHLIAAVPANGLAPGTQKPPAESAHSAFSQRSFRLRRWPKPSLLKEPGSMRLATLLTSRAIGMDELVFRSELAPAVCEQFLALMQAENLMMHPAASGTPATPWTPPTARPPGTPAWHTSAAHLANLPAMKAIAQPGLLARIRMRFGIKA